VLVTDRENTRVANRSEVNSIYEPDYPIVNGRVYVFDRETGKSLLPVPAEVDRQGLALHQPVELPVLGFVSHVRESSRQGQRNNMEVLVLNKATGSTIERATIRDATTTRFRMYRNPQDADVLLIDMANHRVKLEFTEEAAAPEPPADCDVEGSRRKGGGRGVLGLFSGVEPRAGGAWELAAATRGR
jgi:hypothetical protein